MKAPFRVDVSKLRTAFLWLKQNHPYYLDVEWRDDWAEEWKKEDVDIGSTRDEDMDDGQSLVLTRESFEVWMQWVERENEVCADGFQMGKRLLALCESCRNPDDDSGGDLHLAVAWWQTLSTVRVFVRHTPCPEITLRR